MLKKIQGVLFCFYFLAVAIFETISTMENPSSFSSEVCSFCPLSEFSFFNKAIIVLSLCAVFLVIFLHLNGPRLCFVDYMICCGLRFIRPYHLNRFSVISSIIGVIFILPLMLSFLILSL